MIDWFRTWSKGIVIAVIISTIIEMILPNNTSKKYIKIIIGIFVVYTIISPVIEQFIGTDIDEYIKIDDYIEVSSNSVQTNEISSNANESIKRIYKQNLENDLKTKLKEKGYVASEISVSIKNDDTYNIDKIDIKISEKTQAKENEKQAETIVDYIQYVTIKIDSNNQNNDSVIDENDKNTIKKYINENYDVPENQINIS